MNRGNQAWLIRRGLYGVTFIVSVVLVIAGKATPEQAENWTGYVDEAASLLAVLATGLATVKTGPYSDDQPVTATPRPSSEAVVLPEIPVPGGSSPTDDFRAGLGR